MSKRYKVLQLQPDYNVKAHDFADLAEQIVKCLPAERFDVVSAFLRGQPGPGEPVSRAQRSVYFEFSDAQLKGMRLRAMWQLYRFCRAEGFDVVVCNRFKPVNMFLQLNRWLRVPVCIGISHGFGEYDRLYRRLQTRRLIDKAWRFVGVSPAVRQYLLDCACGFTERNTVAITNAIDIPQAEALQLPREEARRRLDLPQDVRLVGALGRLVPVKGHIYLIRAFAQTHERFPHAHLAIIGAGREEQTLRQEAERLGIADKVHLTGSRPDALQYVRAFDIWAMPSLKEGLGLALLEGMSGRLPVIGSDIPAMRPLLLGAGGQLVPPGDADALARALADYLALDDQRLREKGDQSYAYLCREHDIDEFRQHYLDLIEGALRDAGKGRHE